MARQNKSVEHRTNNSTKDRGKNRGVLLRVPDLAARLNVSPSWIRKRCMSKAAQVRHAVAGEPLPCRYLGGVVVFDPREIDAWLKRQPRRRRKPNGPTIFAALEHAKREEAAGGPR